MKKLIILIALILITNHTFASESMRRCLLLPVKDSVGGAVGFKVFQEVEQYLKDSEWCYYKSNSEILNILGNYRNNLDTVLQNPEVLSVLAQKTKTGSLVKVKLENLMKGTSVKVEVYSSNGKDLYFQEKTQINTDDHLVISQTVKNWLDIYEKTIPYDARVIGVLGNQLTLDVGKNSFVRRGRLFDIRRPTRKKRHPLLKEIVDWDTKKIGEGKVVHSTLNQSQAKMDRYEGKGRLRINDWIVLKKDKNNVGNQNNKFRFEEKNKNEFGKLGQVGFFLLLGSGSDAISSGNTIVRKIGGKTFGVGLKGELWATRNYWGSLELSRSFASYSQKEGSVTSDSNSVTQGTTRVKIGYKYLPLGFFYGPQVDGYMGYASYNYGLDNQVSDGFTEVTFKGLLIGAKGSVPIKKAIRLYLEFDFTLKDSFTEDVTNFGEAESVANYHIEFGGSYKYNPNMTIEGGLSFLSNKAKFLNPDQTLHLKDTVLKAGTIFNF